MNEPVLSVDLEISLRYAHGLGGLSPYFSALIRGEALASRCDTCERAWFAPRLICVCQNRRMTWQLLGGGGILRYLTSGRTNLPGTTIAGDFIFGLIQLDGASNFCLGRVKVGAIAPRANQRVHLVQAERNWVHPSQSADFSIDASGA